VRHRLFPAAIALTLAAIVLIYSNHFENGFHFDDFHTITNNPNIGDLHNLPHFFTDARTFSILPGHQSYRPLLMSSLALDYWMGKGPNPLYFQVSTFLWYMVQLVLMYGLFLAIFSATEPASEELSRWFALFAVALYALHPVMAETVNYIIQRGEILSTVGVLGSMVFYIRLPRLRYTGLYLVPAGLAILAKTPAAMFAGILFTYILLFEEEWNIRRTLARSAPALIACFVLGGFVTWMEAGGFAPGGSNPALYRLTQPSVIWNYFRSFFSPSDLSADSDYPIVAGTSDPRVLAGLLFVAALGYAAWRTSRVVRTRPIAFGIVWFLLALAPTSWVPLAEVLNDHRMYFPFVGLSMAAVWTVRLAIGRELRLTAVVAALSLLACGLSTWQRNEVWRTEETLWRDVTEKSPRNGRGHMNYGLTQMAKGDFAGAQRSFEQALSLSPDYSLLHINIGIALGAVGRDTDAEEHFRRAQFLAPNDSQSYFYYARWLAERHRSQEAIALLEIGVQKNQADPAPRELLARLRPLQAAGGSTPTAGSLVTLSLDYYRAGQFAECIRAARQAIDLNPGYAEAYNNIAAAHNALGQYEEGVRAAKEALRLKPDFILARNNLAWAQSQQAAAARAPGRQ